MTSVESDWCMCWERRERPSIRLFCFPYAGGSAQLYRTWCDHFSQAVEVHAVELPGHGKRMRERPITRLEDLVSHLADTMPPLLQQRWAFFGHSMGATIAVELARALLDRHGLRPARVFVSGRQAPHLPPKHPPIHHLSDDDFAQQLKRFGGTREEVFASPELLRLFIPILKADFEMLETHREVVGAPLTCDLSALGGRDDPEVDFDDLPLWAEYTSADFRSRVYSGDHFFPLNFIGLCVPQGCIPGSPLATLKSVADAVAAQRPAY